MNLSGINCENLNKTKSRTFKLEWKLGYFFRYHGGESQCVICRKHIICKSSNIRRHYEAFHSEDCAIYEGAAREKHYNQFLSEFEEETASTHSEPECKQEPNEEFIRGKREEFTLKEHESERASYEIAYQLVLDNRPFTDGEFVKSCIVKAVGILSKTELPNYEAIGLSADEVQRRVQELANQTEVQLKERIKSFVAFSIALDECKHVSEMAQLAVFVRGVDIELNITEELLDVIPINETPTGEDILNCVDKCVNRMGLPWSKLICMATDGSKVMTGNKTSFIGRLRKKLKEKGLQKDFCAVHCLIHKQALCVKAISLQNVLDVVIAVVNFIKAKGLNQRELKTLLESSGSVHTDSTDVLWLSRGDTLYRFFELREEIIKFLESQNQSFPQLQDPNWLVDLAFLTDIIQHLNELNLAILEKDNLLYNMHNKMQAFRRNLSMWRHQLKEKTYYFFPHLQMLAETHILNITIYCEEIAEFENQFKKRFAEVEKLQDKFEIFVNPFDVDVGKVQLSLQFELNDLQCSISLKSDFKEKTDIVEFYKRLKKEEYPNLRAFAAEIIAMFGSTNACDKFCSLMKLNKSHLRNQLSDDTSLGSYMRLATARNIAPNAEYVHEMEPILKHSLFDTSSTAGGL